MMELSLTPFLRVSVQVRTQYSSTKKALLLWRGWTLNVHSRNHDRKFGYFLEEDDRVYWKVINSILKYPKTIIQDSEYKYYGSTKSYKICRLSEKT